MKKKKKRKITKFSKRKNPPKKKQRGIRERINFKLGLSKEKITPHSGLAPAGRFLDSLKLRDLIKEHLPHPGSNRGYATWKYIYLFVLMFLGGGRHLEDMREVTDDVGLMHLLRFNDTPSVSTLGDWLRRMGGLNSSKSISEVVRSLLEKLLIKKNILKPLTLWLDTTLISSGKSGAEMTYKGFHGYNPIVGIIKELQYIMNFEFRPGNESPSSRTLEFFKDCIDKLPSGYQIGHLNTDSAFYNSKLFNYCFDNNITFCTTADKDIAVKEAISGIKNWEQYIDKNGKKTDRELGETIHTMNKTKESFRLVVLRRLIDQMELFNQGIYEYHIIATNLDPEKYDKRQVLIEHNTNGIMENCLRELKNGFNASYIPTCDFNANAFYFSIDILAYNIFILIKHLILPLSWRNRTIETFRWALIELGGKITFKGRQVYLNICTTIEKYNVYIHMINKIKMLCKQNL